MNHIFIYAIPTSQEKGARIADIAAVLVNGFGPYKKQHVLKTFRGTQNDKQLLHMLYENIYVSKPFVLISFQKEITKALLRNEHNENLNVEDKFLGRAWIDLHDLAWPFVISGQLNNRSLEALAKFFSVNLESDDAAGYVAVIMEIYGFMIRRYMTAIKGESVLREIGGESLQNFRNILGF